MWRFVTSIAYIAPMRCCAGHSCKLCVLLMLSRNRQTSIQDQRDSEGEKGRGEDRAYVHEDDAGVGHQLHGNGQPLALLHREPALARDAHLCIDGFVTFLDCWQ